MMVDTTSVQGPRTVGLCELQPATVEGVRCMLQDSREFEPVWSIANLALAYQILRRQPAQIVLLDKAFGLCSILEFLDQVRSVPETRCVLWGASVAESEALRVIQAGCQGILFKSADQERLLTCLRTVAAGGTFMDHGLFRDGAHHDQPRRTELTTREQQVLELVERGLRNREIASSLGIRPGTVKIHLRHIFEKTGVRGRSGLVLSNMGRIAPPAALAHAVGDYAPEIAATA